LMGWWRGVGGVLGRGDMIYIRRWLMAFGRRTLENVIEYS